MQAKTFSVEPAPLMAIRIAELEMAIVDIIDYHDDAEYVLKRCAEMIK